MFIKNVIYTIYYYIVLLFFVVVLFSFEFDCWTNDLIQLLDMIIFVFTQYSYYF